MQKEIIAKGQTVEAAIAEAVRQLGVKESECEIQVLEAPKRTLFGKYKGEAVVKVTATMAEAVVSQQAATKTVGNTAVNNAKLQVAVEYLKDILKSMKLESIELSVVEKAEGAVITFNGEVMAVLIGHHGETLDSLQYLIALTCNRVDGDYYRVSLDCGNYREKRETTLEGLAKRIAEKVKRTSRSQFLEPMNPYERRIIHAVISEIPGVASKSRGDEPNRRVVIMSTSQARPPHRTEGAEPRPQSAGDKPQQPTVQAGNRPISPRKPEPNRPLKPYKQERSMEEILKKDMKKESAEKFIQYDSLEKDDPKENEIGAAADTSQDFKTKENDAELFSKFEL